MPNKQYHTLSVKDAVQELFVDPTTGLTSIEVDRRRRNYGQNKFRPVQKQNLLKKLVGKLREEPMIALLLVTGVLYALWGELTDAITIIAVILVLWIAEEFNEERAKHAIQALSKLSEPNATLRRDGEFIEIPMDEIVPGDILLLQAGRRVPADARLMDAFSLSIDESSLTGESSSVDKQGKEVLPLETPFSERSNLVFSGTLVTRGRGTAIVTATGSQTEIGRLATLAQESRAPSTSLQKAMNELSKTLVWFAFGFSVLVPVLGVLIAHQPFKQMLLTGLTLAFATIPEEMPIIITIVLALGANRLAKQNAIVRRLQTVESLGAATVIATDKTGTLTENRMEVAWVDPKADHARILNVAILCNSAVPDGNNYKGDPLEVGLLHYAQSQGFSSEETRTQFPLVTEFSFDNDRKRMSVITRRDGQIWSLVKGAPEAVLLRSSARMVDGKIVSMTDSDRKEILSQVEQQAAQGMRMISMAQRVMPDETVTLEHAESELVFLGLVGLNDPVRPEAKSSIIQMQRAGIRTLIITGDHPLTARNVAKQVGLDVNTSVLIGTDLDKLSDEALQEIVKQVSVFARTTPEHKLRIVRALQANGERVVVTGDGTNDAPALAAADIGVAMGETGTDVAREAAGLVLADDNYTTIVNAIREGRLLFENLRKGVKYYLACKVGLVLVNLLPVLFGAPVPFSPVQIILMELFMDLAASATFVAEPAEADLLARKPRNPRAKFMDPSMITGILSSGAGLFLAVSAAYLITWYDSGNLPLSQTVAFFSWLIGHVLLAVNMRSERQPLFQLGILGNRPMLIWAAAVAIFLVVATISFPLQSALKTVPLMGGQIFMILGLTILGTAWQEVVKLTTFRQKQEKGE